MRRLPIPLLPRSIRLMGVIAVATGIFYYSVLAVPSAPSGMESPWWDKQLHFVAYGTLALALAYATVSLRDRPYLRGMVVIGLAVMYGLGIEALQGLLPHRYFGLGDILANTVGALLVSLWFIVERRIRYRRVEALVPLDAFSGE